MTVPEILSVGRAAKPVFTGISWLWRWSHPDIRAEALDSSATDLADVVAEVESRRLAELGVARGRGISVGWQTRVSDDPDGGCESGTLDDVGEFFRATSSHRMVVLGVPGAGKTVTALHLLLHLLEQRKLPGHAGDPVPLRVNAASWDPATQEVTEWVARQLATDYSMRLPVARKIVQTRRLLVVLDGVDEMDSADQEPVRARAALDQFNNTHWLDRAVVLTCRTDAYDRIRELRHDSGLHDATFLELQPVHPENVLEYIEQRRAKIGVAHEKWAPITDRLRAYPSGPLATALKTPWLLSTLLHFLRYSSEESIEKIAVAKSYMEVEDLVFSALIPSAVAALPLDFHVNRKYSESQVHSWLERLARHYIQGSATSGGSFGLNDIWELAGQRKCRLLHFVLTFLAASCGMSMIIGSWNASGLVVWLCIPAYCGIRGALPKCPAARTKKWRTYKRGDFRRWIRAIIIGLPSGLVAGLIARLASGHSRLSFYSPNFIGIAIGLIFGIAVLLAAGLTRHRQPQLDEKRVIRDDITAATYTGILMWIVSAEIMGSRVIFTEKVPLWAFPLVSILSMFFFLPYGIFIITMMILARAKASVRYFAAKILFALRSDFPTAPGPFLDWARAAGLLRVTGAAYQFRHISFQRWLAG